MLLKTCKIFQIPANNKEFRFVFFFKKIKISKKCGYIYDRLPFNHDSGWFCILRAFVFPFLNRTLFSQRKFEIKNRSHTVLSALKWQNIKAARMWKLENMHWFVYGFSFDSETVDSLSILLPITTAIWICCFFNEVIKYGWTQLVLGLNTRNGISHTAHVWKSDAQYVLRYACICIECNEKGKNEQSSIVAPHSFRLYIISTYKQMNQ